jgi:L-ascorbate metabolism protein UlaG (beta-lactamase superfamily)
MQTMKPITHVLLGMLLAGACAAADLGDYKAQMLSAPPGAEAGKKNLTVMFIGVATLLFDDGETAIMTDGFFSRPARRQLRNIRPDRDAISRSLRRAGVTSLAAVIPVHSHYDHALDSPVVAMETGALLVGSSSTANIARGYGLPDARVRVVNLGDTATFGRFKLTFLKSAHLPTGFAQGPINAPLSAPASASEFKEGDCYSLFIEHDGRTMLVQGSAGFIPGALKGHPADVVYLGIGGMGTRSESYQNEYWQEVVRAVGAKRVVPIHWDNFFRSLDDGLVPNADFYGLMNSLLARGKADGVDIRLSPQWMPVDPFAGL